MTFYKIPVWYRQSILNILNLSLFNLKRPTSDGIQKKERRVKMEKIATKGVESKDTKIIDALGILFVIIIFIGFSLLLFFSIKSRNNPHNFTSEAISSVYKLQERLKGRMLVMEKGGFNDSDNYKQAGEIKTELKLVRDKLSEIKIKLKDKPWAN